ncbi:MAG: UbiD family decarboxylase, partial [Zetaproteobacteria bacterium]|nr:UbiD family decarboxylase [Zetaproteobacteria bacterium]
MHANLKSLIQQLRRENEIIEIDAPVDPRLEIAEIHRRVIAAQGPALLFTQVKGSKFPVVTNLFGTAKRILLAFGKDSHRFIETAAQLPHEMLPPTIQKVWQQKSFFWQATKVGFKSTTRAPVLEQSIPGADLTQLPALTSWSQDGGPFLTLPLVHTVGGGVKAENLGMYRIQIHDAHETGVHFQIGKGGGYHYLEAEKRNQAMPMNIYLGGPPALILAAIAPLPENVPETLLASLCAGQRLSKTPILGHPVDVIAEAEFAILGTMPPKVRRPEGPFGDHYGYYSLQHDYPVFRPQSIFHRQGAIFPATVVGKPRQEDFYLGDLLQEILAPLFPVVMPAVKDLWSYGETGYHALSAACLKERYNRESMSSVFRILGEGQLSLTKFLLATDGDVPLKNFTQVLTHILERADFSKDLYIFSELSMDTLDY